MNDRYKLLAVEAAEWCEQHAKGTPVAWEWEEKFAEMIVQECLDQVSGLIDREFNGSAELETLLAARTAIEDRFGLS